MLTILDTEHLTDADRWAVSIRAKYTKTVEAVFDVGRELLAAKAALPHGEFQRMVRVCLPFHERTAQMYMAVAKSPRLADPDIRVRLPNALNSLTTLARIDQEVWEALLAQNEITPDKTNNELAMLVDLYKVRVRGEVPRPLARPFAEVIPFATPAKPDNAPCAAPRLSEPLVTDEPGKAIEGELMPRQPESEPPVQTRPGLTIDANATSGSRQYQNQGQLLRAARRLFDKELSGKRPDPVELLAWVAAYDIIVTCGL